MRIERFPSPRPVPGKKTLTVFGISWRPQSVNEGLSHPLRMEPLSDFYEDWRKTRTMDLLKAIESRSVATKLACLEACARHQIEGYAGRLASLTASFGHDDLGDGELHCWAYVNHLDVPEHMRAHCEANLYGTMEPKIP